MQDAKTGSNVFVGIDVAKQSFDVARLPGEQSASFSYDDAGLRQLREWLGPQGVCFIVLEATGGLERRIAGELIDAGHQVSIANPRQVRDFARGRESWPRPTASTRWCSRASPSKCGRESRKKPRKNSSNWLP